MTKTTRGLRPSTMHHEGLLLNLDLDQLDAVVGVLVVQLYDSCDDIQASFQRRSNIDGQTTLTAQCDPLGLMQDMVALRFGHAVECGRCAHCVSSHVVEQQPVTSVQFWQETFLHNSPTRRMLVPIGCMRNVAHFQISLHQRGQV